MFSHFTAPSSKDRRPYLAAQRVRGYWEGLRPKGGLPNIQSLDPRGFASDLEHVFLADMTRASEDASPELRTGARLRVAGRGLSTLAGRDMQRADLAEMFALETRPFFRSHLERVFAGDTILSLELEAKGPAYPTLAPLGVISAARLILLPLESGERHKLSLLGCLIPAEPAPLAPVAFRIARTIEEDVRGPKSVTKGQLIHVRHLQNARDFVTASQIHYPALAEAPPARFDAPQPEGAAPQPDTPRRWPWLRLI